jgi:hypothetical protein
MLLPVTPASRLASSAPPPRLPTARVQNPSPTNASSRPPKTPAHIQQKNLDADVTLTLALPKTGLGPNAGELYLGDIAIPQAVYEELEIPYQPPSRSTSLAFDALTRVDTSASVHRVTQA